jgi:hypothetical protein
MDPALVIDRTRNAQGELATAGAVINAYDSSDPGRFSGHLVPELLEGIGG